MAKALRILPFVTVMPIFVTVFLLIPSLTEAQRGFRGRISGERLFQFLDRNRDGQLDPEEMERIPGSLYEWLEDNDVDLSSPLSLDEFVELYDEMTNENDEDDGDDDEDNSRSGRFARPSSQSNDPSQTSGQGTPERSSSGRSDSQSGKRIEPRLPDEFREADLDGDGQIGLYEWRRWKKRPLADFQRYDVNGDGFITPREFGIAASRPAVLTTGSEGSATSSTVPSTSTSTSSTATTSDDSSGSAERSSSDRSRFSRRRGGGGFGRSRDFGGSDSRRDGRSSRFTGRQEDESSSSRPANSETNEQQDGGSETGSTESSASATSATEESREAQQARTQLFPALDVDGDGIISPEEWNRSRSLKPLFENAGIDLSRPMTREQFVENYVKIRSD